MRQMRPLREKMNHLLLNPQGDFFRNSQFCGRKRAARSFHCQNTESKGDAE